MKKYLDLMSQKTKLKCIGIILLAAVSSALASIWPVQLGELYNAISDGTIATIVQALSAVAFFGLIYLAAECISILRRVAIECIIASHEADVRKRSVEKLLKMPVSYFGNGLKGERTAQLNQGINGLSQLIKMVCNDIFATALTAVCTLMQVVLNAPLVMSGIMILYLILTVVISIFQIRSQNGIRESIVNQKNHLDGQICQSIENLQFIRTVNAESYEIKRVSPTINRISSTEKRHHSCMGMFDCLKQVSKISFQVIIILISVLLVSMNMMHSGTVITVCLLFQQLIKPIDEIYRFMDETASSVIKARKLTEVHESASDSIYDICSSDADTDNSGIRVHNAVVYNPEKTKIIAKYDNVFFPAGKTIALCGANGCGKTSLALGLIRYYEMEQGSIEIFGKRQCEYSQKELTDIIYYSPQLSFFFEGTVRDNLLYGIDKPVSDEILINALKMVHLTGDDHGDTIIDVDPKKALESHISEKVEELSGGMKQRLALARAFLRKPRMFIFDEITANLDKKATNAVLNNIEKYAASIGAGIIYISHDHNVVERCEYIETLVNKANEPDSLVHAA